VNEPLPGSPTAPLWREMHVYRDKEIFSLFSVAPGKEHPSMFPKCGAPMETDAHFQCLT